jgi:carbamoyl-phosphate synthase small subunit
MDLAVVSRKARKAGKALSGIWARAMAVPHDPRPHVVAMDFGAGQHLPQPVAAGSGDGRACETRAGGYSGLNPDGVFLSNGPGDPAATGAAPCRSSGAAGTRCAALRHLPWSPDAGLAAGAKIKMHQGHRGANHPVKRTAEGVVEITSMNHGFAVDAATLPEGVVETHVSLFDGSNCGIEITGKRLLGAVSPRSLAGSDGQLLPFHENFIESLA